MSSHSVLPRRWLAVATALLASGLAACSAAVPAAPTVAPAAAAQPTPAAAQAAAAPTPPSQPAAATPAALTKVVASYSNVFAIYLPMWMAKEGGIYEKNGLDVDLQLIEGSRGVPALLAGETQFAASGGPEQMTSAANGAPVKVITVDTPVQPFVFVAPPSITSPEELKGKKIGVSSAGGGADLATRLLLPKLGLDPDKDVSIIAVGSLENRVAALVNGATDAGVAQVPDTLLLQSKGFHVLIDLADRPDVPGVGGGLMTTTAMIDSKREVVQRFIDSHVEGHRLARQDRPQALKVLSKYLKTDDQQALNAAYDYYLTKVLPPLPIPKAEHFAGVHEVLSKTIDKVAAFDLNTLVDDSFVKSAGERGLDK